MGRRFLITGLPRCRSAWLAAFFTAHGHPCIHEPWLRFDPNLGLNPVFDSGFEGVSCTGLPVVSPESTLAAFSGHPSVFVERGDENSRLAFESALNTEVGPIVWRMAAIKARSVCDKLGSMVVDFNDLDDFECLNRVSLHLTGSPANRTVFDVIKDLKITQFTDKVISNFKSEKDFVNRMDSIKSLAWQ